MGKRKSVRKPLLEADDSEQGLPFYETLTRPTASVQLQSEWSWSRYSHCQLPNTCPGGTEGCGDWPAMYPLPDSLCPAPLTGGEREEKHHALFRRRHKPRVVVDQKTTATYCISFTAVSRGQHKLHVAIDGVEVGGSPCDITVFPDPHQLKKSIDEIPNGGNVWGAAVNSRGQIIASKFTRSEVVIMDGGEVISSFDCRGPTGITTDSDDNIYVSCVDHIEKFSSDGQHVKSVGKSGHKEAEFISPEGLAHHNGHIYVCDTLNNRIQVLDTDLNYMRSIGCEGSSDIEFSHLWDIDFDSAGRAYITDKNNNRVQVIDVKQGGFLKQIGHSGDRGKLSGPTSVTVVGGFVYVSDDAHCRVAVFKAVTGEFVTSFGGYLQEMDRNTKDRSEFVAT